MRKCLTSFGYGRQADNFKLSSPRFAEYANRHRYDYHIPQLNSFDAWRVSHPDKCYAWLKLPLLSQLLCHYDVVLWIDADVVMVDGSVDILAEASAAPMSMAVHRVAKGRHPNTGVWLLRREAKAIIDAIDIDKRIPYRLDRWYEQAALHRHFGMDLNADVLNVPHTDEWGELPYRFNAILKDDRGIPDDVAFVHAAGFQHVFDEAMEK